MFDTRKTSIDDRIPSNDGELATTYPCSLCIAHCITLQARRLQVRELQDQSSKPLPSQLVGSHRGSTDPQSIKNSKSPSSIASVRPSARSQHNSATASALQVSTRKQQTANVRRTLRDSRRDPQNHASFDSKQYILLFVKCHSTHPTTKLMPPPAQPPSSQHQHPPSHTRLCPSNRSWSRRCRWGDVGTERRLRRSGSSIHKSLARCIPSH